MLPPKPISRKDKVSLWQYMKAFKQDILSAQPERLYRAWMAEYKKPVFPVLSSQSTRIDPANSQRTSG